MKKMLPEVKIAVCTTGWLLHTVRADPGFFAKWTHVVLDEVHERTIESDLMALICKDGLLAQERQLKP